MANKPNKLIQDVFNASTLEIVRRVEIYEYDGKTPWKPEIWPNLLIEGSVSADQTSDARRTIDVELNNTNGYLNPEPGKLWYDKVLKVFYGIVTHLEDRDPRVIIIEEYQALNQGLALKRLLSNAGVKVVHYNPQVSSLSELEDFDIVISISSSYTRKLTLLTQAFEAGKSVITFNTDSTASQLPYVIGTSASNTVNKVGDIEFSPTDIVDTALVGWNGWISVPPNSYRKILTAAPGSLVVATASEGSNGVFPGVIVRSDLNGQSWCHVAMSAFDNSVIDTEEDREDFAGFLSAIIKKLDYQEVDAIWEAQIGEFLFDTLAEDTEGFGFIQASGRDYTKRCLNSKLSKATMFKADQKITDVISSLAANCGITKQKIPTSILDTIGKDTTYERDQVRWEIMKEIALANNYEIYFDAEGYLILASQQDPILTPPSLKISTGPRGNLVSRGRKSSDSNIFNKVTVVGESSDTTVPLVYGEAVNDDPNSKSSTVNIGERTKNISSPLVTSDAQATDLAKTLLAVSTLEEFEMSFSITLVPWIEPGEILEMSDDLEDWGPARYLISSITLPLDLSPLSGTAKRVVRV